MDIDGLWRWLVPKQGGVRSLHMAVQRSVAQTCQSRPCAKCHVSNATPRHCAGISRTPGDDDCDGATTLNSFQTVN